MDKSTTNGHFHPFSIAMLVYQRVPSRPFGFRKHDTAVLDTKIGFREDLQETQKYVAVETLGPADFTDQTDSLTHRVGE